MARPTFSWPNFLIRLVAALVLVFALSFRLREDELRTHFELGARRD